MSTYTNLAVLFSWHDSPPVGLGPLIIVASKSHSDTPFSVGLLWTSDRTERYTTLTRDISVPPEGFEPAIPTSEWPQIHVLDRATTGIGTSLAIVTDYWSHNC